MIKPQIYHFSALIQIDTCNCNDFLLTFPPICVVLCKIHRNQLNLGFWLISMVRPVYKVELWDAGCKLNTTGKEIDIPTYSSIYF